MCIVCEIKNKLLSEVASQEVVSFVLARVELMAECMQGCVDYSTDIVNGKPVSRDGLVLATQRAAACLSDDDKAVEDRNGWIEKAQEQVATADKVKIALQNLFGDVKVLTLNDLIEALSAEPGSTETKH